MSEGCALEAGLDCVEARLPGLLTTVEDLVQHAQRSGDAQLLETWRQPSRLFDVCLALDCARGRSAALEAFTLEHRRSVRAAWRGARIDDVDSEELWQSLLIHLFVAQPGTRPRILSYSGRGPLGAWVRITAVRFASANRRSSRPDGEAQLVAAVLGAVESSPELDHLEACYRPAFRECFRTALGQLPAHTRALLRQALVHGMTTRRLAKAYGVHHTSITRRLIKARGELLEATQKLLAAQFDVPVADVNSILVALRGRLEISFAQLSPEED